MSIDNLVDIRWYEEGDWGKVQEFLRHYWGSAHPLTYKELFDWQFEGFGNSPVRPIVVERAGEIVGFRGLIPGIYQVKRKDGGLQLVPGAGSAIWTVSSDLRGKGIGRQMHEFVLSETSVLIGAQSTPETSRRLYIRSGFSLLERTNRYVLPLKLEDYAQLLVKPIGSGIIEQWISTTTYHRKPLEPSEPDLSEIEFLWKEVTIPLGIESIHRSEEFWRWRYRNSKGFKYLFFSDGGESGYAVGRSEKITAGPDTVNGKEIYRLIELIPRFRESWTGDVNPIDRQFLERIIVWAKSQSYVAIDFYISTDRFDTLLTSVGFRKANLPGDIPEANIAVLFQPFQLNKRPMDVFLRANRSDLCQSDRNFYDTYIVKSDADLDRPNIWPLP